MAGRFGRLLSLLSVAGAQGNLLLRRYSNTALAPPAASESEVSAELSFESPGPSSAEVLGVLTFPGPGSYTFDCAFTGTALGFIWLDGHLICHDGHAYDAAPGQTDLPLQVTRALQYPFRAHLYHNPAATGNEGTTVGMSLRWGVNGSATVAIPKENLSPVLPELEQKRDELQRSSGLGWGTMLRSNYLAFTSMPAGAAVELALCSKSTGRCIEKLMADGQDNAVLRLGRYAADRSYGLYSFAGAPGAAVSAGNVSVEFSAGRAGLRVVAELQGCPSDFPDLELRITGRFVWYRAGNVSVSDTALELAPLGLRPLKVFATGGSHADSGALVFPLSQGPVAVTTFEGETFDQTVIAIREAGSKHEAKTEARFGAEAETAVAVEAAVTWLLIVTPSENGFATFMPVTRNWGQGAKSPDFDYVIFDWDNFFASLMVGLFDKDLAYSEVIQTFKTKTSTGFIPNIALGGGSKTQDRTEPPVGAKVLLMLYERFGDKWIVELLFDDCLDWLHWFQRRRLLPPLNLVALGSFNEQTGKPNTMNESRFESGLDNSPMYDGDFYNTTTGLMQMYDVGFSTLLAQEFGCLAKLAEIIGRPEAAELKRFGDELRNLIRDNLWDDQQHAFINRFPNGTFSDRISPTSFYPLQVGVASDNQAATLVREWLFSPTRFCIAPNGDFQGNSDDCYWGLPSIQASDPAFPALGYWRGYVWAPMGLLTFWSFQKYDHVPVVRQGRKAMISQLQQLMLSQWRRHGHICENFGPHKDTEDCTGEKFYHWGALMGWIALAEQGHWTLAHATAVVV